MIFIPNKLMVHSTPARSGKSESIAVYVARFRRTAYYFYMFHLLQGNQTLKEAYTKESSSNLSTCVYVYIYGERK